MCVLVTDLKDIYLFYLLIEKKCSSSGKLQFILVLIEL